MKKNIVLLILILLTSFLVQGRYNRSKKQLPKTEKLSEKISSDNEKIRAYDPEKNKEYLKKLFQDNWATLIGYHSQFSVDYFLTNLAPTNDPRDFGLEQIFLYYYNREPIGFISLYKIFSAGEAYTGRIHFLCIEEKYRNQHFGEKLIAYGLEQLKKQGIKFVYLKSFAENLWGISLYKRMGFKEILKNENILTFGKCL